ncbi:hypothetical protein [Phormidium nigroviride]
MNASTALAAMVLSWDKQTKIAPSDVLCFQEGNLIGMLHPFGFTIMSSFQFNQYAEDIAEVLAELIS